MPKNGKRQSCCEMQLDNAKNLFNRKNMISFSSELDEDMTDLNMKVCEEFYPEEVQEKNKLPQIDQNLNSKASIESGKMALCRKASKDAKNFAIANKLRFLENNNNMMIQNFENEENLDYVDQFDTYSNNNKSIFYYTTIFTIMTQLWYVIYHFTFSHNLSANT